MYPAEYEARFWDEIDGKMVTVHGVTMAESFTDAMEKVEEHYGDELDFVSIILLEEASVYEFESTQSDCFHGTYKVTAEKW